MASVQERLQLKRMPLENWSISEQLYLASAVANSGDQNWMSVSRQLRSVCGSNRPSDWFSQKSCAAQYEMLLENVEPTKRKKRNEKDTSQAAVETPIVLIQRKLTVERVAELQKLVQEEREEYLKVRNEIANIQNNVFDENQLREMLQQAENEERQREREKQKYAQWLKEREERKKNELERQARTNPHQSPLTTFHSSPLTQHLNQKVKVEEMDVDEVNASPKQGTSPLLTSLLKSPSAAPNPSPSMLHNLSNQARVSAPTITNLLTGSVSNLSSSLANVTAASVAAVAAQQSGVNKTTIVSSGTSISTHTVYTSQLHNHPLTGPPSNEQIIGSGGVGGGGIVQSPSQAAPTLSMLLENKQKEMLKMPPLSRIDSQNAMCATMEQHAAGAADTTKTEPTDTDFHNAESPIKDEDQNLLEVFNELIPDDIGELADILLDDLINEEQNAAVSQAVESLEGQVNLDLKSFQSQSAHTTESADVKVEPCQLNENNCDSTVSAPKIQDPFDALKEQKDPMPMNHHIKNEKKLDLPKHDEDDDDDDDDSDLSNDTPLSELIKQEASAKQQRSQTSTPKDISSTTEQPDEVQAIESMKPDQLEQPVELDGNEQSASDDKVDNTTDLLDNQMSDQDIYVESTHKDQPNDFNVGRSQQLPEEKPSKIELSMPIDSFESDSNDEKSMENIKREIEALPELKDSNSSENSQDEKIGIHNTMVFKENAESTESAAEKLNDNSVDGDRAFNEKFDTDTIDLVDTENEAENDIEPADSVQPVGDAEKDEQVESIEIADESIDLTESKGDTISEQNKSVEDMDVPHEQDNVEIAEKSESIDSEKIEILDADDCQAENGEMVETQAQEEQKQLEQQQAQQEIQQQEEQQQQQQQEEEQQQQHKEEEQLEQKQPEEKEEEEEEEEEPSVADSTAAEIVMEISSDDMQEKDDDQPSVEETADEIKAEADSSQLDTDDCIEIKSEDQKPDPVSPLPPRDEKPEKSAEENSAAESSVKKEQDDQMAVDSKRKTPTPKPTERKVSTDDELFEDAKETLEVEVKPTPPPSKRITPAITCDTDDDSVIEVVKEEKVGVKRDYSRRKKDQSHSEKHNRSTDDTPAPSNDDGGSISSRLRLKDRERSESPFIDEDTGEPLAKNKRRYSTTPVIDSPNSPASSDDRDYRSWKKSILLLYNSLAGHRCASIFAKPITDEQAPNYSQLILQPMDLQSLKRNIDSGQIRNIFDFQLYVMRMCYNAIFYNINDDVICERAKEMLNDALQQIAEFSVTWKKESEKASSASSTSSNVPKTGRGRKSVRLMN